jgi:UDP-glucose 4-epimerase
MATFLITGGAGFIGSHLSEAALEKGHRVLVLDDLSSGRVENLSRIRQHSRFEFVPESVTNKHVLAEMVDRADIVYHLAATVGVFNIIESPAETIVNNIGGTENVLQMAAKKKKKVIVASTSEVYGKRAAVPFGEEDDVVFGATSKSRWSYAASKMVDEFLALAYYREYHVPTVVARLFNCIGPRQIGRYGMVVPRLLTQAIRGENVTVYGSGQQSRCFTYVSDVVRWLMILGAEDRAVGEVFNLGNPQEITINDLARKIIALTGSKSTIEYIPYEKAYEQGFEDMERRVPNINKIVNLTGYSPTVSLEEMLIATRDWLIAEHAEQQPVETLAHASER